MKFDIVQALEQKRRAGELWITPAYGRSYATVEEMERDWREGRDFKIWAGPYCSIRDLDKMKEMGFQLVLFQMPFGNRVELHSVIQEEDANADYAGEDSQEYFDRYIAGDR